MQSIIKFSTNISLIVEEHHKKREFAIVVFLIRLVEYFNKFTRGKKNSYCINKRTRRIYLLKFFALPT